MSHPIVGVSIRSIGFPPRTTVKTAAEILHRIGMKLVSVRGDLIAVRMH